MFTLQFRDAHVGPIIPRHLEGKQSPRRHETASSMTATAPSRNSWPLARGWGCSAGRAIRQRGSDGKGHSSPTQQPTGDGPRPSQTRPWCARKQRSPINPDGLEPLQKNQVPLPLSQNAACDGQLLGRAVVQGRSALAPHPDCLLQRDPDEIRVPALAALASKLLARGPVCFSTSQLRI